MHLILPSSTTVLQAQAAAEGACAELVQEGAGQQDAESSDGVGVVPLRTDASRGAGSWAATLGLVIQDAHRSADLSGCVRERASRMRRVAMEWGLCRSGRMRAAGPEVGQRLWGW